MSNGNRFTWHHLVGFAILILFLALSIAEIIIGSPRGCHGLVANVCLSVWLLVAGGYGVFVCLWGAKIIYTWNRALCFYDHFWKSIIPVTLSSAFLLYWLILGGVLVWRDDAFRLAKCDRGIF